MNSNSEDTKVANRKKYARSIGVLDDDRKLHCFRRSKFNFFQNLEIMNNIPANGTANVYLNFKFWF